MLRGFSLRDFGASLNTAESYTNESSQGKIGLCETANKQKCTHLGIFLASEINNLKKSISGLEDDGAIQQLTDQLSFINEYMEGIQKILDRLQDSSTGFGIVNSAWDAQLIQGSYDKGGVIDYTGLAQMHGTKSSSEIAFNARDGKKLYDLVHGSDSLIDMFRDKINKTVYQHNANATNNKTTNIYATFGDIVSNNPETFAKFMKDYLERVKSESGIF